MKNLLFGLIGSILFVFAIWVGIAYDKYGADLINHHLNLEAMFIRFKNSWISYSIYDDIKGINELTEFYNKYLSIPGALTNAIGSLFNINFTNSNDFFQFVMNFITILTEPITAGGYILALIGYGTYSITRLLITCFAVIGETMAFLFNPIFI